MTEATKAATPQQEPSMEEILASIRRIISDDGEAGKEPPTAPAAAAPAPTPAPAPPPAPAKPAVVAKAAEPLELTKMVGEDGKVTELKRPAEPAPPPAAPAPVAAKPAEVDGLISAKAAAASATALANLAALSKPREQPEVPGGLSLGSGGITLEEMVRQELRGQLKSWLDANLTGIVERMVQKEIKRITSQADPG